MQRVKKCVVHRGAEKRNGIILVSRAINKYNIAGFIQCLLCFMEVHGYVFL